MGKVYMMSRSRKAVARRRIAAVERRVGRRIGGADGVDVVLLQAAQADVAGDVVDAHGRILHRRVSQAKDVAGLVGGDGEQVVLDVPVATGGGIRRSSSP